MRRKFLGIFSIICIFSLARCYDIRLLWEFEQVEKTIFDLEYPDLYKNYNKYFVQSKANSSKDHSKTNKIQQLSYQSQNSKIQNASKSSSAKEMINSLIQKMYQIGTHLQKITIGKSVKVNEQFSQNSGCNIGKYMFQQQVSHFTRNDYSFNDFYPGALIELVDPTNFAKGIVPVYDQLSIKNPTNIKITGKNFYHTLANISTIDQYKTQLYQTMLMNLKFLNSQPIKFYIMPAAARIENALNKLGLGSSIYQKLFIAGGSEYYTGDNRIVFVLHQTFFSATLDFSNINAQNTNKTLFDLIYSNPSERLKQKFMRIQNRNEKLPQFISQVNYGRLLVVSLADDKASQKIIDKMGDCFNKEVLINEECFNLVSKQIRSNPTLRYYYAGIDQSSPIQQSSCFYFCKAVLKWKKVFFPINEKTLKSLQPISLNAINFLQQRHKQIDRRYFTTKKCIKNISIKMSQLNEERVQVVVNEIGYKGIKHSFNITHPGTFQIGSLVGNRPFELNMVAKNRRRKSSYGLKFFFLKIKAIYSIQAQFAILINGQEKMRHIIGNSRSDRQSSDVRIYFDPDNGRRRYLEPDNTKWLNDQ